MSNIRMRATDGFRYLEFEPPIDRTLADSIQKPIIDYPGGNHNWEPSSIDELKNSGLVFSIGWVSDAFVTDEVFTRYAESVAGQVGGYVLNPNYFDLQ